MRDLVPVDLILAVFKSQSCKYHVCTHDSSLSGYLYKNVFGLQWEK